MATCRESDCCNESSPADSRCLIVQIITEEISEGEVGTTYEFSLSGFGGTTPYIWTIISGSLPDGLTLSTDGIISGVPTEDGTFEFTVKQVDANGNSCEKNFTIAVNPAPDMPLNDAVYESGRDVIFAVNGGRIYKLNATTGKKISDARFTTPDWGPCFITYAPNVDKLCASIWNDPVTNSETPISGIFTIDPDTFAVDNFATYTGVLDATFGGGPQGLEYSSNFVFGTYRHRSGASMYLIKFNPATNSPTLQVNIDGPSTYLVGQCAIKISDGSVSAVRRQRVNNYTGAGLVFNFFTNFLINGRIGRGLAHDLTNDNYYVVTGTQYVQKAAASAGASFSEIDTGRANANPQRAKWNSVDGKIYIPGWKDNTVIIIDPASADAVTVKTGFDSPYGIVFTPSKVFAVQHSAEGLREVT